MNAKLSLDAPQRIGRDFEIPDEEITPQPVENAARLEVSRKRRSPDDSIEVLLADHPRFVAVVGESHYQDALRRMAASATTARVTVEGEPSDPFDKNAVRIANDAGETLGYLAKGQYTHLKRVAGRSR